MNILDIQIVKISKLSFCLLHSTDKYFYKVIQLHLYSNNTALREATKISALSEVGRFHY